MKNEQKVCGNCDYWAGLVERCDKHNNEASGDDTCKDWKNELWEAEEPQEGESEEIDELIAEAKEENARDDEEIRVKRQMPKTSNEMAKVIFTEAQLREMADEMARKIGELDEKEAAKKR